MINALHRQIYSWPKWLVRAFFLVSVLFSFAAGMFVSDYFRVRRVIVTSEPANLLQTDWLKQQNLLLLSQRRAESIILAQVPRIARVNLTKKYPQTLVINFTLRRPLAQIKNDGFYLLIDSTGHITNKVWQKKRQLLTINYYQKIRSFESVPGSLLLDKDILYAIGIIQQQEQFDLLIKTIEIKKPGEVVFTDQYNTKILVAPEKAIAKTLRIVHNISKTLRRKGEQPREINLLFEKPVVTL